MTSKDPENESGMTESEQNRVVVVSNRLPLTLRRAGSTWRTEYSSGGLATAMQPILRRTGGIWIGWHGDTSGQADEKRQAVISRWRDRDGYIAIDIPPETAHGFYDGFANQALWPLLHQFQTLVKLNPDDWQAYVDANTRFRDAILAELQPSDLVWIHDYQLMLLPRMLREAAPEANIGFFLHVPFPSSAVFRILPRRGELLEGLLGADYVAFHTYSYLQHFRESLLRALGIASEMDRVELGSRLVRLDALPIGIAPGEFTDLLLQDDTRKRLAELKERFKGGKIILSVDRLDYTKGIPERLRAFRKLLQRWPEMRGRVALIQVAVPSRERIPMYHQLRREVDELVGKVNGEFGSADWSPVIYLRRGIPKTELVALYAAADVAWVSPLRDGLNLVAKEYVACNEAGDGALVLSEFAGAAAEMGEAFLINPFDEDRTAEVVMQALSLPEEQRRERMRALARRVARNNVFAWGDRFVTNLADASRVRAERAYGEPKRVPIDELVGEFGSARRRLVMLDYDGTLVPFSSRPPDATPGAELLEVLDRLAAVEATTVAIISGRARGEIEEWFRPVPRLWLAAEHGAATRAPGSTEWEVRAGRYSSESRQRVHTVLEHFVDRTPGSFIEEKEFSVVWHYRMSDPEFGEWLANELVSNLGQMLADTELRAVHGNRMVEVRPIWANKGQVGELLLARERSEHPGDASHSFILAAGDDRTDEDLFAALPPEAWSVHVGTGRSLARFRVSGPSQMVAVLEGLAESYRASRVTAATTD